MHKFYALCINHKVVIAGAKIRPRGALHLCTSMHNYAQLCTRTSLDTKPVIVTPKLQE